MNGIWFNFNDLLLSLVSTDLQINCHSYLDLFNRDLYLRLRGVLPYGTFSKNNLTSKPRLGFQKHTFPNKESFLGFYFLFFFK